MKELKSKHQDETDLQIMVAYLPIVTVCVIVVYLFSLIITNI